MNAIVNTTEPNTAILQLPEETETLIKASVAENTLKAYQRALQSLTAWLSRKNPLRCPLSQLHHHPTRKREIPSDHRASRRCSEVATQTPITGNR